MYDPTYKINALTRKVEKLFNKLLPKKRTFLITRHKQSIGYHFVVGVKCYKHHLFSYWFTFPNRFTHFDDTLLYIRDWCCKNNIRRVKILDPGGPNKKIKLKYEWKEEEIIRINQ